MSVEYNRVNFKRRFVEYPNSYTEAADSGGGITHTPSPGNVMQEGTLPTEENMNQMDKGIKDCAEAINAMEETIAQLMQAISRLGTDVSTNARAIAGVQNVNEAQSRAIASVTSAHNGLAEDEEALEGRADSHIARQDNPHNVTKTQLGLDKVQNVSTNDQTPTYTEASSDQNLASGEKMSTAFGKISRAVKALWQHIARTDNPHEVTPEQIGAIAPVSGIYVGLGDATRTIELGFTPNVVIYCDESGCFADDIKGTRGGVLIRGYPQYCWGLGYDDIGRSDSYKIAEIVNGGFALYHNNDSGHTGRSPNKRGYRYMYIAW